MDLYYFALVVLISLASAAVGMTYSRWTPGSCCGCEACLIQEDFVSSDWTGAGWTFSTSTASGSGYGNANNASSEDEVAATYTVDSMAVGDKVRVLIQYTDSNNYLYGEVERQSVGFIMKSGTRSSGTDTDLQTSTPTYSPVGEALYLCYSDDGELIFRVGDTIANSLSHRNATAALTGTKAGIWSDATVTFSLFEYSHVESANKPTCPNCQGAECPACTDSSAPILLTVSISGMQNGTCSDCSSLDGTYVVEGIFNPAGSPQCGWEITGQGSSECWAPADIEVRIWDRTISGTPSVTIQVVITMDTDGDNESTTFEKTISSDDIDCNSLSETMASQTDDAFDEPPCSGPTWGNSLATVTVSS